MKKRRRKENIIAVIMWATLAEKDNMVEIQA